MKRLIPLMALALLAGCATMPKAKVALSGHPTYDGYMGLVFEQGIDGSLVGVNFVHNPYTRNKMECDVNNSMSIAHTKWPTGHTPRPFCLPAIKPAAGRLTLITVVNHGLSDSGFIAVALEFWHKPKIDLQEVENPIFGARVLGQAPDEQSCINVGKATIRSSLKHHEIKHQLTISCIAIPPKVEKSRKGDGSVV